MTSQFVSFGVEKKRQHIQHSADELWKGEKKRHTENLFGKKIIIQCIRRRLLLCPCNIMCNAHRYSHHSYDDHSRLIHGRRYTHIHKYNKRYQNHSDHHITYLHHHVVAVADSLSWWAAVCSCYSSLLKKRGRFSFRFKKTYTKFYFFLNLFFCSFPPDSVFVRFCLFEIFFPEVLHIYDQALQLSFVNYE